MNREAAGKALSILAIIRLFFLIFLHVKVDLP